MIVFRNVSLSRRKSTTRFGVSPFFSKNSDNFHWTFKQNIHFTDEYQRKKSLRSASSNNNYSFRIINNPTTTTIQAISRKSEIVCVNFGNSFTLLTSWMSTAPREPLEGASPWPLPSVSTTAHSARELNYTTTIRDNLLPNRSSSACTKRSPAVSRGATGGGSAAQRGADGRRLPLRADTRCSCAADGDGESAVGGLRAFDVPKISQDRIQQRLVDRDLRRAQVPNSWWKCWSSCSSLPCSSSSVPSRSSTIRFRVVVGVAVEAFKVFSDNSVSCRADR